MNDKDTYRMHTKVIQIGDRKIGGGNPIAIQSMTNTKTEDVKATVEQILRLEKADPVHRPYGLPKAPASYNSYRPTPPPLIFNFHLLMSCSPNKVG